MDYLQQYAFVIKSLQHIRYYRNKKNKRLKLGHRTKKHFFDNKMNRTKQYRQTNNNKSKIVCSLYLCAWCVVCGESNEASHRKQIAVCKQINRAHTHREQRVEFRRYCIHKNPSTIKHDTRNIAGPIFCLLYRFTYFINCFAQK